MWAGGFPQALACRRDARRRVHGQACSPSQYLSRWTRDFITVLAQQN
jgi:hypothetical protein